jgi:hypothetical protein
MKAAAAPCLPTSAKTQCGAIAGASGAMAGSIVSDVLLPGLRLL